MKRLNIFIALTSTALSVLGFALVEDNSQPGLQAAQVETSFKASRSESSALAEHRAMAPVGARTRFDQDGVLWWERAPQPFPVILQRGDFSWTEVDGKSEETMALLANNEDMLQALRDENAYVKRRQLIYVDSEIFDSKRDQILDGSLKALTLPGFDGQELKVEIDLADRVAYENVEDPNGGFFGGRIIDQPDSQVMVGTAGDSYTIQVFDGENLYHYDSREKGELILSEIDQEARDQDAGPCTFGEDHHVGALIEDK